MVKGINVDRKAQTIAKYSAQSVDLKHELDKYIRLVQWMRETLENSLQSGMGYKKESLTKDDVNALSNIGIALDRAVSCKIKYDKHTKAFADQMTPEEEIAAIEEYITGLDKDDRFMLLRRCLERHNLILKNSSKIKMVNKDVGTST